MTHTMIRGKLEFMHQVTGEYQYRTVLFAADSETPWTEVMDMAIEIAQPTDSIEWVCTSDDLREEEK